MADQGTGTVAYHPAMPSLAPSRGLSRGIKLIAGAFSVSGLIHLIRPQVFEAIVPRWAPRPRALVYASGVAELACAAGLLTEQRWAGPSSAGLLLAVWPANIQMAIDDTRASKPLLRQVALWARVPMQVPMVVAAWRARRS